MFSTTISRSPLRSASSSSAFKATSKLPSLPRPFSTRTAVLQQATPVGAHKYRDRAKLAMASKKNDASPPGHEMAYFAGLAAAAQKNDVFRTVKWTGLYSQLVTMEVPVDGEIGDETHTVDQILIITSGKGLATIAGKDQSIQGGDVIVVPAGTRHQFVTKGDQPLQLITVYSPAEHATKTVHKDKEQGDKEEEDGIDVPPEWARKSKKENEDAGLVSVEE